MSARHVVVLAARQGWHTDQLCRALDERGARATVLPYEALVASLGAGPGTLASADVVLQSADAVLARIIPNGSLEQIIYRVDALHWLEASGVRVINSPRAIERTVDKFFTTALLARAGLPTPETVVCERSEDAIAAFRRLGDVIIKPLFGSMGLGMVRVADEEMAWRVLRTLDQIRAVYYVQRTIDHGGRDIRAFVVAGRILAAIERTAPTAGPAWRTNVSRGGGARSITLPPDQAAMAIAAARAVGADYAGVDLLPARDGTTYALEVNGIPGWRGVHDASNGAVDVAGAIADLVFA